MNSDLYYTLFQYSFCKIKLEFLFHSLQMVTAAMKLKESAPWKKSSDQPRQHIKKQRHHFANKGLSSQSYGFPVVMYGCESWTIKKDEH